MRGLPMIRSLKAAVALSMLMLLPLFTVTADAITSVCCIVICVTIMTPLLIVTAVWAGLLPAIVGWVSAVLMAWLPFGMDAGLLMALFLLPGTVAFLVCVQRQTPFFRTALIMIAGELMGGFAVLLILNRRAEGEFALRWADQFAQLITDSGMQDELLLTMLRSGLTQLDPNLYNQARGLLGGLSELGREELLLSLKANLTDILGTLPAILVSNSIWHNLLGLGIGIYFGRRSVIHSVVDRRRSELMRQVLEQRRIQLENGEVPNPVRLESREQLLNELNGNCEEALKDFPTLQMPPFSLWHLPRRVGLMAALPGLGYLVALYSDAPQAQLVGNMLGCIFSALYTIQGMATMDFILGHGGRKLGFRCVVLAVCSVLLSRVFLFVGIADQLFNIRKLRPPLGEETNES